MTGDKQTPAERWQAAVDAETESLRDEFDRLYEGMSEAEIAARAAAAIAKFSKGDGQ